MLKTILMGTTLTAALWGIPAQAQMQPSPEATPETTEATPLEASELRAFAVSLRDIARLQQAAQQEMADAIQEQGLNPQEFQQIQAAVQANESVPSAQSDQYNQAVSELQGIQQAAEVQMGQILEVNALDMPRFNELLTQYQADPSLQAQVQEVLQQEPAQ
ncbi:DUF4168 domain-containing protein [Synechococcales cyanobacterium C]|uniref:DUF4168 domain-containing protein n=1 Tax=Petrachloros mirabilis ULC683 TaxID=2781853 RepID=A0A8K1ZVZ2_9CYAN|nr:DUF4168 domain-containing protein [Petrachloros mirabilis]NCJ05112.1 DUF4168 domain-containing protein [Petrachloros mirabilis ULC683]